MGRTPIVRKNGNPFVWRQNRRLAGAWRDLRAWCRAPWRGLSGWVRVGRVLALLLLVLLAVVLVLRPWETTAVFCFVGLLLAPGASLPAPDRVVLHKNDDADRLLWLSGRAPQREVFDRFWCVARPALAGGLLGLVWIAVAASNWLHGWWFLPDPMPAVIVGTCWLAAVAASLCVSAAILAATIRAPRNMKAGAVGFGVAALLWALWFWLILTQSMANLEGSDNYEWLALSMRMCIGHIYLAGVSSAVVMLCVSTFGTVVALAIATRTVRRGLSDDGDSTPTSVHRRVGWGLQTIETCLGTVRGSPLYQAWRIGALRLARLIAWWPGRVLVPGIVASRHCRRLPLRRGVRLPSVAACWSGRTPACDSPGVRGYRPRARRSGPVCAQPHRLARSPRPARLGRRGPHRGGGLLATGAARPVVGYAVHADFNARTDERHARRTRRTS